LTFRRSSRSDSLSIHTHSIRGLELNVSDPRANAYGGYASLKIAAGERFRDIHAFAAERNVTVVGGADTGFGIGGWVVYGRHSPISGRYGMGADQVLEMEEVTADGVLRTVNEHNDRDLFWALGGVSTPS
jgi:FAD/FMN-containing dehydrogenase